MSLALLASWATWWASQNLPAIEWVACGLSFAYVLLAARNSVWCWPLAFAGSCVWAYQVWTAYALWFDAALNVFYAAMAVVGLWRWTRYDGDGRTELPITRMSVREHLLVIAGGAALSAGLAYWALAYTAAALPVPDAATTVFSVLATFLLIGRRLENWLYLLAVDAVYVWLYLDRGSVVFAATFVVYTVMAYVGYRSWRRELRGFRQNGSSVASAVPNGSK